MRVNYASAYTRMGYTSGGKVDSATFPFFSESFAILNNVEALSLNGIVAGPVHPSLATTYVWIVSRSSGQGQVMLSGPDGDPATGPHMFSGLFNKSALSAAVATQPLLEDHFGAVIVTFAGNDLPQSVSLVDSLGNVLATGNASTPGSVPSLHFEQWHNVIASSRGDGIGRPGFDANGDPIGNGYAIWTT